MVTTDLQTQPANLMNLLEQAKQIFVGKEVVFTHTNGSSQRDERGLCTDIVVTHRPTGNVDFVLSNGHRIGLCLQNIDAERKTCSGTLYLIAGTRTATVVNG